MYKNTVRFLKEYLPGKGKGYFRGVFCLIITIIATTTIPIYVKNATNNLSEGRLQDGALLQNAIIIIALAVILFISRVCSRIFIFLEGRKIEAEVRQDLFNSVVNMPIDIISKYQSGDLISRGTNDVTSVRVMISMGILHTINTPLTVALSLFYMFSISVKLTLFCLIPLPLIILGTKFLSKRMMKASRETQQQLGTLSETVREQFRAHTLLSIFPVFSLINPRFKEDNDKYAKRAETLMAIRVFMMIMVMSILSLGMFILLRYGGPEAIETTRDGSKGFDIGAFTAFSLFLVIIQGPLRSAGFLFPLLQRGEVCLQRIYEVRDEAQRAAQEDGRRSIQNENEIKNPDEETILTLSDVDFSYNPDNPESFHLIIDSLEFKKGRKYGIFGATGCGKTTLFNLICCNMRTSGLKLKGTPYEEISSNVINQFFSIVPQENKHFSKTIRENIDQVLTQKAPEGKTRTGFDEAYKISQIKSDIDEFKNGLDTLLGEHGINLSGGQKQRLSILRALVKPREVLLMDDFISAVDHKTETRIIESLYRELQNETLIFISHRVSALLPCDEILIMDKGKIIDSGTHEELLKRNETYLHTFEHQMMEKQVEDMS